MTKTLQLCYPVTTLEGRELLPAGALLNQETMIGLVRSAEREKFPSMRFMEYGTISADLGRICEHPPYCQIFSDPKRRNEVFSYMGQVDMALPLLDIYGYFKEHDPYTYRHILTVFALSLLLAQDLMDNRRELAMETVAAPNHDFGKICVPLSILKKSSPLEDREQQRLSHHAAAGYVILSYYLKDHHHPAAVTARDHHERMDGSGYPRGIPQRNRVVEIVAVGDIFDALISSRPYRRRSFDLRTALELLTLHAEDGAISLDVVHALINCNRKLRSRSGDNSYSHEFRGTPPDCNNYSGAVSCSFEPGCAIDKEDGNK